MQRRQQNMFTETQQHFCCQQQKTSRNPKALLSSFAAARRCLASSIENFFEQLGFYVYDHTVWFIVVPPLICLLLSVGFLLRATESDMERLYGIPNSPAVMARNELNRVFPVERIEYIFATSREGELLSQPTLQKLDKFWDEVLRLRVPKSLVESAAIPGDIGVMEKWWLEKSKEQQNEEATIGLDDICIKESNAQCKTFSFLELYSTPSQWGHPLRTARYPNFVNFRLGKSHRVDSVLGGIVKEVKGSTTVVYNATSGAFRLHLNGNDLYLASSAAWEQALIALVKHTSIEGVRLDVRADRSLSDELTESSRLKTEDVLVLFWSAVFVFVFTVVMASSRDWYRSLWLPAAVGVASTLLAYGGGVGLCHLLGLKHVPPSESTPFIILGIGADDIFVVLNAYSLTYVRSDDSRKRIGLSFKSAGISITLTTLTNILAFAIGACSIYYSIRTFCLVTAAGLLFGYLLCLTLFAGVLALHAKFEQKYRSVEIAVHPRNKDIPGLSNDPFGQTRERSSESLVSMRSVASPQTASSVPASLEPRGDESLLREVVVNGAASQESKGTMLEVEMVASENILVPDGPGVVANGLYVVEELDGFLVVAESVAEMYRKKEERLARRCKQATSRSEPGTPVALLGGLVRNVDETGNHHCEKFDLRMKRVVEVEGRLIPIEAINFKEPKGTVGRWARRFFMRVYGRSLTNPVVKFITVGLFLSLFGFTLFYLKNLQSGLEVRDITPYGSYLRSFYDMREKHFTAYGDECVVFFPDAQDWWSPEVQRSIVEMTQAVRSAPHVAFVLNGFEDFLEYARDNTRDAGAAMSEQKAEFDETLSRFLQTPRGSAYSTMFTLQNGTLTSWKFYYWMKFQDNTLAAFEWFNEIRSIVDREEGLNGYVFTPLAVMWESDPLIFRSTISNMVVALFSMGLVASLLLPDLKSALLVLIVIVMIDLDICALMPVWSLKLNMLTMVNLVLSIGFAVDYTAHMVHCFSHCKGTTRNRRVVETLILMGLPVSEGMISTYAAIAALFFSKKYTLMVVFRMTTLVMVFAFLHGIVLMPVVLSLIGPRSSSSVKVVRVEQGTKTAEWMVNRKTGDVIPTKSKSAKIQAN